MTQAQLLAYLERTNPQAVRAVQAGGYATALPQFSVAEKALLYHYTDDGYDALNATLHAAKPDGLLSDVRQALEAVLAKLPPFVGETFSGA